MDCLDPIVQVVSSRDTSALNTVDSCSNSTNVAGLPPFHYLASEQAKSILALQELQNEVGALLEFRDLVMETFPHLRQKITVPSNPLSSSTSQIVGSPGIRWEPGVRVRRKLGQQTREQDIVVPSLLPRCRSNSHGKGPKSGEGSSSTASSAIQDSGFCAESKEHSGSSSTSSGRKNKEMEDELWSLLDVIHQKGTRLRLEVDHLRNKLNRDQSLPSLVASSTWADKEWRKCRSLDDLFFIRDRCRNSTAHEHIAKKKLVFLENEVNELKKERIILLDRITEMENEQAVNLTHSNHILAELEAVNAEKHDLEEQLHVAISSKSELNSRIHDLHSQFVSRNLNRSGTNTHLVKSHVLRQLNPLKASSSQNMVAASKETCFTPLSNSMQNTDNITTSSDQREDYFTPSQNSKDSNILSSIELDRSNSVVESNIRLQQQHRPSNPISKKLGGERSRSDNVVDSSTRVALLYKPDRCHNLSHASSRIRHPQRRSSHPASKTLLGTLDGIVSNPSCSMKIPMGAALATERVAAILNEFNPVELQRHLLTSAYQNETLNIHMECISKSRKHVVHQLQKTKDENDELKFKLEEKNIQLEGTRARVRMLERLHCAKLSTSVPDVGLVSQQHTLVPNNPILPHLNLPICSNLTDDCAINAESSTESTPQKDHQNLSTSADNITLDNKDFPTPRKRPSKIPLKSYSAPKPPIKSNNNYKSTTSIIRTVRDSNTNECQNINNSFSWGKSRSDSLSRNWDSSKNSDLSIMRSIPKDSLRQPVSSNHSAKESVKAQDVVTPGTVYKGVRRYSSVVGGTADMVGSGSFCSINSPSRAGRDKPGLSVTKKNQQISRVCPPSVKEKNTLEKGSNIEIEPKKFVSKRFYQRKGYRRRSMDKPPNILPAVREVQEMETDIPINQTNATILFDTDKRSKKSLVTDDCNSATLNGTSTTSTITNSVTCAISETSTCDSTSNTNVRIINASTNVSMEYFDSIESEPHNTVSSGSTIDEFPRTCISTECDSLDDSTPAVN